METFGGTSGGPGEFSADFLFRCSLGLVAGASISNRIGTVNVASMGTPEDVMSQGGTLSNITAGEKFEVVSDDINDTAAGTGLRTLRLFGLNDVTLLAQTEDLAMNGQTPVPTTKDWFRITGMLGLTSGVYGNSLVGANIGTISCTGVDSSVKVSEIAVDAGVGVGNSESTHFTVPAGSIAFVLGGLMSADGNKEATVHVFQRGDIDVVSGSVACRRRIRTFNKIVAPIVAPSVRGQIPILEKTDVWMEANVGANATIVDASYSLLILNIPQ